MEITPNTRDSPKQNALHFNRINNEIQWKSLMNFLVTEVLSNKPYGNTFSEYIFDCHVLWIRHGLPHYLSRYYIICDDVSLTSDVTSSEARQFLTNIKFLICTMKNSVHKHCRSFLKTSCISSIASFNYNLCIHSTSTIFFLLFFFIFSSIAHLSFTLFSSAYYLTFARDETFHFQRNLLNTQFSFKK